MGKNKLNKLIKPSRRVSTAIRLLLLFAFSFSFSSAWAQPQYSVGSTTSGANSIPFGTGTWADDRCQMLYLPGDFGTVSSGMAISTIYFVPTSSGAATFTDLRIDIGQASITGLSSSSWVTGLTNALTRGSYSLTRTTNQWWAITLDNPIPYDPTMPLIIDIRKTNSTSSIAIRNQGVSGGNRRAYSSSSGSASPTGASTTRYTFGFDLKALAPDNAGISDLVTPKFFCQGSHDIKVNLQNTGVNQLNSVKIHWELDGVAQPDINWNSTLASGAKTVITLKSSTAFTNVPKSIKVWTSLPNNMADTVNSDDTLDVIARTGLDGTYTVGGTSSDFATVKDAVDVLNKYGVCGAVTMNIANGVYTDAIRLGTITGVSASKRVTFQSQSGVPSDVVIQATPSGNGYVMQLASSSYITFKNITIQSNGSNAGRVVEFMGSSSYDSLINCTINASTTFTSSNTAGIYGTSLSGSNNIFIGNRINRGYYGIYFRGVGSSSSSLIDGVVFDGNTITNARVYSSYFYYTKNLKFRNNTITTSNNTTHYGIYAYYCDKSLEITGNKIRTSAPSGTHYGMRFYYNDATSSNRAMIANNVININNGTSTGYGMYVRYTKYNDYYNNTVNINNTSTSSFAGYFYYSSSTYQRNTIRNNVFSNMGGGRSMYIYRVNYNNTWDYNNLYTTGTVLVQRGSPSGSYNDLKAWRTANKQDLHSISYNPGYTSNTNNLEPDVNNPSVWSLNGRGVHYAANANDIQGSARATLRADGVPDIGAYEFEPNVIPPLATPVPPNGTPGTSQQYEFGGNIVATINWGTALQLTTPLEIRQYSGRKGPSFVEPGFMYFYTDIQNTAPGSSFDFSIDLNYMDIWLGTISNETDLKLAHRFNNSAWVAYNGVASKSNISTNVIDADDLINFGQFTGIDNNAIFSAIVKAKGSTVFCTGDGVRLDAETGNTGTYTYQWRLNNVDISGATAASYFATQPGDYTVVITDVSSSVQAESIPVTVSSIAPPNALVNASGPLTYCTGGNLALTTPTQSGYTYQWQLNGSDILGADAPTLNVSSAGSYTVRVGNIGCDVTSAVTNVASGPLTVDLGNDINTCEDKNMPIVLDAGYPGAKYAWSNGATTQQVNINKTGTYWVQVDGGPNCIDIDTIRVQVDPLPSATGISYVKNGNEFLFSPSNPQNVTSVFWEFGDGTTYTTTTVTKTVYPNIFVRLVLYNACGADTMQIGFPLSVANTVGENDVVVYPNPASDKVTLEINGNTTIKQLTIINSVGAVVYQQDNVNKKKETINTASMPTGYYMIKAVTTDGTAINKPFNIVRQ